MEDYSKNPKLYAKLPLMILTNKKITDFDRVLYGFIGTLSLTTGYCFASNKYLSDIKDSCIRAITKSCAKLQSEGLIRMEYIYAEGTKNVIQRRIYLTDLCSLAGPVTSQDASDALDTTDTSNLTQIHSEVEQVKQDPINIEDLIPENNYSDIINSNENTSNVMIKNKENVSENTKSLYKSLVKDYPTHRKPAKAVKEGFEIFKKLKTQDQELCIGNLQSYLQFISEEAYIANIDKYIREKKYTAESIKHLKINYDLFKKVERQKYEKDNPGLTSFSGKYF